MMILNLGKYVLLCWLILFFFMIVGCDKLKGDRGEVGEKGKDATTTKFTYGGAPAGNPYLITIPELADFEKLTIDVYAVRNDSNGSNCYKLPFNNVSVSHQYLINTKDKTLTLWSSNGTGGPVNALLASDGVQMTYQIIIRRFDASISKSLPRSLIGR